MKKTIRLTLLLLWVFQFNSWGQHIQKEYDFVSIKEGIPKVGIPDIVQDHKGFIWIATNATGLYKFDGINYTSYKHILNDSTSLSSSRVDCTFIDSKQRLWVGTENGLDLYNSALDQFQRFVLDASNPNSDKITTITEDASNNLYIGTYGNGIFKLNINSFKVEKVANSTFHDQSHRININSIEHVGNNKLYVGTNYGLKEIDVTENKLVHAHFYTKNKTSFETDISTLMVDRNNQLWVGTQANQGVYKCTLNKNQNYSIISVKQIPLTTKKIITFAQLADDSMMIGTENDGLFHLDHNDAIVKNYIYSKEDENSLLHNSIWKVYVDNDGRIWMGYFNSGVAISDALYDKFKDIKSSPNKDNSLKITSIMALIKDENENLWMATDGGGIDVLNTKSGKITHINSEDQSVYSGLQSNHIMSLYKDSKGNIWAGSWDHGLFFLEKGSKKFISYSSENAVGLKSNTIRSITEDAEGTIWIGTSFQGLHAFNPETKDFTHFNSEAFVKHRLNTTDVSKVLVDTNDDLWLGSVDGLFKIEKDGMHIKRIHAFSDKINKTFNSSSNTNYILSIYEDSKTNIWVGTRGTGLYQYNTSSKQLEWYNRANGLEEDNVAAIIEDADNNIWVSGNSGLTKIDLNPLEYTNYTFNDGLLSNDFNAGAVLKDCQDMLYFGNLKGLDYFHPNNLKTNAKVPILRLTDFKLFNETVIPNQADAPLNKTISETNNITLNSDQSVFTIEYTGINFTRPEKNNYAYYLEGYEDSWNYVGQKRSATYTNLDQGNYTFKLKSSNNDGVWNETPLELSIEILPPWWKTTWAIILYILLFLLSFYYLNHLTQSRIKEKELIRNERIQRLQQDELNQKKIQFFTNISHEFRTPLTLIMNPLKDLIHDSKLDLPHHVQNKHAIINKNADRLYRLINELMDFRKLELNKLQVKARQLNLLDFTKNIVSYFKEEANNKNILLSVDSDNPNITVWADVKMLEKIIFNLLSNAIKITPEGGAINIELLATEELYNLPLVNEQGGVQAVEIIISDTGPGLKAEEADKIFERFYQVENQSKTYFGGTGIGLEVVQSFVKLHKGNIEVTSEVGVGTTFKILLPLGHNHFKENQIVFDDASEFLKDDDFSYVPAVSLVEETEEPLVAGTSQKQHTILVVEDNQELRAYLKLELSKQYKVLIANNGVDGLKIAKEAFPDVVLTDVVMPEMDGMAFCKHLKKDLSTSHIPVLMLTAKAKVEDRIEGIETGADAYLVKPFNIRLLKLRLAQLITSRQLIFNKYFSVISEVPQDVNSTPLDKEFIENVLNHINKNIGDPNLNVESLASQLNLSRSQFYRKIKALTNQTASEFLRNIRLQKAKQILEMGETNISKVCYATGFSSHSYFTKCFKNHFGFLPTEVKSKTAS
ncbi:two-component regulator propeller domain-containing protein [Tamlana sp. 2_MG-2023]|uniref:hybrid sensor histidine kinase/response regulator transcription factor n=1 Tax=unclassified Tamlana TaxID=2614803 RepID=UPI0026E285EC|nr:MULTISPECIES: two-component regulator propeller domain-containing protein [unclassified Tamlana]MDO6759976.1 two-component regulator propeller domain-containing protein [Tamlana sp. 2_MG-2023]MDO6791854.1 two-component regulator propeller domain-containing protein [Tamlana sp. 1_MG-2023]